MKPFIMDCETHFWLNGRYRSEPNGKYGDRWMSWCEGWTKYSRQTSKSNRTTYTLDEYIQELFVTSEVDMACCCCLDYVDMFAGHHLQDPEAVADACQKYPNRLIGCGILPVLDGEKGLDFVEYQVKKLGIRAWGEIYQADFRGKPGGIVDYGWRLDDSRRTYPFLEKIAELGANTLIIHKGVTVPPCLLKYSEVQDVGEAARSFPEINFIILHLGIPWWEEASYLVDMHENVYTSPSVFWDQLRIRPRWFMQRFGEFFIRGPDPHEAAKKIIWGTDYPAGTPTQWQIESFMQFQFPEDMRRDYGYPVLEPEDKENILGRNLAKLFGINIEEQRKKIAGDEIEMRRAKVLTPEIRELIRKKPVHTYEEIYDALDRKGMSVGRDYLHKD